MGCFLWKKKNNTSRNHICFVLIKMSSSRYSTNIFFFKLNFFFCEFSLCQFSIFSTGSARWCYDGCMHGVIIPKCKMLYDMIDILVAKTQKLEFRWCFPPSSSAFIWHYFVNEGSRRDDFPLPWNDWPLKLLTVWLVWRTKQFKQLATTTAQCCSS